MTDQPHTPNPDQQTPATVHEPAPDTVHDGTGARVLNFRPRSADPVERSARPTVVDGEIVNDTDVQHVAVDPPHP